MTYLSGVILFVLAGYSITLLTGLLERNLIYDIALSWFVGAGYYSLAWFVLVYAFGVSVQPYYSFAILLVPVLIMIMQNKVSIKENVTQSFENVKKEKYLAINENRIIKYSIIVYCVIVIIITIVHGVSTPSNADDALRLRAYTPILAYDNNTGDTAMSLIFQNGPWPTFTTVLFWHISGGVDHFYINYTIVTSFFFFITLLFFSPVLQGDPRKALYNVFLVLSLPFFIYHSTITYADARLTYAFALGFMFFSRYVQSHNTKDLKLTILFFTLSCFIKSKGEILGITGLTITAIFTFYNSYVKKNKIEFNAVYFLSPFMIYFLIKNYNSGNISEYFLLISNAAGKLIEVALLATPVEVSSGEIYYSLGQGLFSSGNFGIIIYILIFNILINIKLILQKRNLIWELFFLSTITLEIYYFLEYKFDPPEILSVIVNRVAIALSVISALFLSSLWSQIGTEKK